MDIFDQTISQLLSVNKVWGVHAHEKSDGSVSWEAVLLSQRKGVVAILGQVSAGSIDELFEGMTVKAPVSLSFDSKRVLHKDVARPDESSLAELIYGADEDNFYQQTVAVHHGYILSFVRKTSIQGILDAFEENGFVLLSVMLSPVNVKAVLPFIDDTNNKFGAGYYTIEVHEGQLVGYEIEHMDTESLRIGDETVASSQVVPYANALAAIVHRFKQVGVEENGLISYTETSKYRLFYQKAMPRMLIGVFLVLLINFFVLQSLKSQQVGLNEVYVNHQYQLSKLTGLQERLKVQKSLLGSFNVTQLGFISYYADRISSTMVPGIKLTALEINPEKENDRLGVGQKIEFQDGIVHIAGQCDDPKYLNQWLSILGKQEFVREIYDQDYKVNNFDGKAYFSFYLKVRY